VADLGLLHGSGRHLYDVGKAFCHELRIVTRGSKRKGELETGWLNEVVPWACPAGMVKRVRGVAYAMKVSPQAANRLVDGARGPLNAYLADVFIFTDSVAGEGRQGWVFVAWAQSRAQWAPLLA
jgi:RNA 3'-terminal phosphate cyclase